MPSTLLSQIPAAELPARFTDPRGFAVRAGDGAPLGTVTDLLVDPDAGAHQLVVDLGGGRRVLVPLAGAAADGERRLVVSGVGQGDVARLAPFDAAAYEGAASRGPAGSTAAAGVAVGEAVRLTLADEQLVVGTRAVQAGEVGVRKTVETERVRRTVPVAREEVTVERRPAVGVDAAMTQIEVVGDEIRIPIFAEEVVVEKRLVPAEEYIVRKRRVTETRTVEADLRHERLAVEQGVEQAEGPPAGRQASDASRPASNGP